MTGRPIALACAALAALHAASRPAGAHAVAGARLFPVTLNVDDPSVADEASLPTVVWQRSGAHGGPGPVNGYNFGGEYDKRITEDVGVAINDAFVVDATEHGKTRTGFQDVIGTLKYRTYVDAEHEFIVSLGLVREFARTGTTHVGADAFGFTQPTVYAGKGFPELPAPLRPLAITGELGWAIADKELKATAAPPGPTAGGVTGIASQTFNNGYANRLTGGFSIQYSLPYLQSQVRDYGLGDVLGRMVPLVEVAYSSPLASPSNLGTQTVVAPGAVYLGQSFQVAVEALIPANRATGTNVGVVAQLHVFLDDLFPDSLGKPLFE